MEKDENSGSNGLKPDLNFPKADSDLGIGLRTIAFKKYSSIMEDILNSLLMGKNNYKNAITNLILQSLIFLGMNLMLSINLDNIEFLLSLQNMKVFFELITDSTPEDNVNIFELAENIKLQVLRTLDTFYDEYTFKMLFDNPNTVVDEIQTQIITSDQLNFLRNYRNNYFTKDIAPIRTKLSITQIRFLRKLIFRQFENFSENILLSTHEVSRMNRILRIFEN